MTKVNKPIHIAFEFVMNSGFDLKKLKEKQNSLSLRKEIPESSTHIMEIS